jgi:hypothetical protein
MEPRPPFQSNKPDAGMKQHLREARLVVSPRGKDSKTTTSRHYDFFAEHRRKNFAIRPKNAGTTAFVIPLICHPLPKLR